MLERNEQPLRNTEISAALAVGAIALLILGLQPILLGEAVAQHLLSLEGVGLVAMGEIVALGLGVILGDAVLPIGRMRSIAAAAAIVVGLLDFAALWLHGDLAFATSRAWCGLAEGVLVWVATCNIVRSAKPDRVAGIFLTSQTLAQAAVAAFVALVSIPRFGWKGGFATLGVMACMILLIVPGLRGRFEPLSKTGSSRPPINLVTTLSLLVVFLEMSAIGSLWPYLDPLGRQFGFGSRFLETIVSLVLVFQIAGGALATVSVRRLNTTTTLLIVAALQGSVALAICSASGLSRWEFAVLWSGFGLLWLFAMPFHVRLALTADPKGRVAMLVPAAQLLGTAFGPLMSSCFVTETHTRMVALICACFALFAAMLAAVLGPLLWRTGGRVACRRDPL